MKLANAAHIRVFAKEGEDEEKIKEGLKELSPFDTEKEKIQLKTQTATGFSETKIKIFSLSLLKERHIGAFIKFLLEKLNPEQKALLLRQKETRLDSELNFFLRLDKEKLTSEHAFWITDSGNCYHITISIAAFPRKRSVALSVIDKMLHAG